MNSNNKSNEINRSFDDSFETYSDIREINDPVSEENKYLYFLNRKRNLSPYYQRVMDDEFNFWDKPFEQMPSVLQSSESESFDVISFESSHDEDFHNQLTIWARELREWQEFVITHRERIFNERLYHDLIQDGQFNEDSETFDNLHESGTDENSIPPSAPPRHDDDCFDYEFIDIKPMIYNMQQKMLWDQQINKFIDIYDVEQIELSKEYFNGSPLLNPEYEIIKSLKVHSDKIITKLNMIKYEREQDEPGYEKIIIGDDDKYVYDVTNAKLSNIFTYTINDVNNIADSYLTFFNRQKYICNETDIPSPLWFPSVPTNDHIGMLRRKRRMEKRSRFIKSFMPEIDDNNIKHDENVNDDAIVNNNSNILPDDITVPEYISMFKPITNKKGKGKEFKNRSYSFVVMATNSHYHNDPELDADNHILLSKNIILKIVKDIFKEHTIKNIIIAHEHGKDNNKCHFHILLMFFTPTRIKQGTWDIICENVNIIMMLQEVCNVKAVTEYIKKDGDYISMNEMGPYNMVLKKDGSVDPFYTISNNSSMMTSDEAMQLIFSANPKFAIQTFSNMQKALNYFLKPMVPPLEYMFPEHLHDAGNGIFKKWFDRYCKDTTDRKIGLFIFSKKRAIGKSCFVRSLVNDPYYLVEFTGEFLPHPLVGKKPKLVHLQDLNPPSRLNYECWKQIVTSQKTTLRSPLQSFDFPYDGVPCVVTSNNELMLGEFLCDSNFNTSMWFVRVEEYLGLPGTEPNVPTYTVTNIDDDFVSDAIRAFKESRNFKKT